MAAATRSRPWFGARGLPGQPAHRVRRKRCVRRSPLRPRSRVDRCGDGPRHRTRPAPVLVAGRRVAWLLRDGSGDESHVARWRPCALAEQAPFPFGGTWSLSGTIVFAPDVIMEGLRRVGAAAARRSRLRVSTSRPATPVTPGRPSFLTAFTSCTSSGRNRMNAAACTSVVSTTRRPAPLHCCCDPTLTWRMCRSLVVPKAFCCTPSMAASSAST